MSLEVPEQSVGMLEELGMACGYLQFIIVRNDFWNSNLSAFMCNARIPFYHAAACNATHSIAVAILSIRPSIRCMYWQWCSADILIPHERAITIVFWHQQWMVGDAPFPVKYLPKVTHPLQKTPTSQHKHVLCRAGLAYNCRQLHNELFGCRHSTAQLHGLSAIAELLVLLCCVCFAFCKLKNLLISKWANVMIGWLGDDMIFLHAVAQKLQNVRGWNLVWKSSLIWEDLTYLTKCLGDDDGDVLASWQPECWAVSLQQCLSCASRVASTGVKFIAVQSSLMLSSHFFLVYL